MTAKKQQQLSLQDLNGKDNGLWLAKGESLEIELQEVSDIHGIRMIHDSDFKILNACPVVIH